MSRQPNFLASTLSSCTQLRSIYVAFTSTELQYLCVRANINLNFNRELKIIAPSRLSL